MRGVGTMQKYLQEYGEYIYHLAYLYVKDVHAAEEITQDVFYTYTKKQQQFRGEASLKTYLTRMAINRSHDELRKMKRRTILQTVLPFIQAVQSTEKEVMKEQVSLTIKEALFTLPIRYREVIVLHYYEDYSIKEIAQLLQTNENTVRTRIRRAKEQLKEVLGELMEEGMLYD